MFFSIDKNIDITFPNHTRLGDMIVNHDNGWVVKENFIYKGVSSKGLLSLDTIDDVKKYRQEKGTFCIFYLESNTIKISTGKKQKFPIFIDYTNHKVSNLYETSYTAHNGFSIDQNQITIEQSSDLVFLEKNLTDNDILKKINQQLENSLINFSYNKPFKLFVTGGFDTLLIASYVLKNKIPYELVLGEHAEMDHFTCYHRNRLIKSFWAYRTIQHWKQPTVLLTGAHGDETLLRDATQAFLFLKHHGENLITTVEKDESLYQSFHYRKPECLETYRSLENLNFESETQLKSWMLNVFSKDYQHWHLGNTLFFSIFDDLDLLDLSLNLSYEKIKNQLLDGELCRTLISMNRPGLLQLLSKNKNHNYFEKLSDLYEGKIRLESL